MVKLIDRNGKTVGRKIATQLQFGVLHITSHSISAFQCNRYLQIHSTQLSVTTSIRLLTNLHIQLILCVRMNVCMHACM